MARYIDADALEQKLELYIKSWSGDCNSNAERMVKAYENALYWVKVMPAADVVPKSEVEVLQGALKAEEQHNELTMEMAKKALANAKAEVAREIFEEIEKIATSEGDYDYVSIQEIAELKKKYTENME